MVIPTDILLGWYRNGIFPMAEPQTGEIYLFNPDPRCIIQLDEFHMSSSLEKIIRSGKFEVRFNTAFEDVMRACAKRDETWISEDIIESYCALHREGSGCSVECWRNDRLVGGLYGVSLGGAFFGESMFHTERDASKVALAALVSRMKQRNMILLDTQYSTPHLARFGAKEISQSEYLRRLTKALKIQTTFYP